MASAVLGRALAFGVGLGVGSLGAYKFILDELRNSTKTILLSLIHISEPTRPY